MNLAQSRREFLKTASVLALVTVVSPGSSFAQPQWLIVLQAISACVSIITGIIGAISESQIKSKLNEMDAKLDQIIALEGEILEAIVALKLYIDQAILNGWADSYGRDIDAYATEFNALAVAPNQDSSVIKQRWSALAQVAPQTTVRLGDVDFGIFPFFSHGLAISIISFKMIGFPLASQRQYYSKFKQQVEHWKDTKNSRSITNSISSLGAEIANRRQALNNSPKKVFLSAITENMGGGVPPCHRNIITYVNISGDFQNGYSGTQSVETGKTVCPQPAPGGGGHHKIVGEPERAIASALGLPPDTVNDVPTVPVFTLSGYAVVDSRNQERIAIFQLMAEQAVQQNMSGQMDELLTALNSI